MGELASSMQQMLIMTIIVVIGLVATRARILDNDMLQKLTRFLVYITLPCMILASTTKLAGTSGGEHVAWAFGLAVFLVAL